MSGKFYITTAIDYPNSVPHMGHAYEKIVADYYARFARLRGLDTYFLIGLDEHGQKIQEAAEAEGKQPQAFVDEKAGVFRELYRLLDITHDDFIRTSEPRHHEFARWMYSRVKERGDIYAGEYEADYCISCERALTKSELVDGKCPVHDRPTTPVREPSYFFRLGKYRDPVREHIERHASFVVPEERRNEVLSRLREEVRDLSVSRSTFRWGVSVPDDPDHVLYVWFDALSNYLSALKAPDDVTDRFWPCDCHVIGKDILWFHTVIWPALLFSAGFEPPRQVYVHGFILDKHGRKMAKTLRNVIDPVEVAREWSVDVLRYYFLRAFASGHDGCFDLEDLEERYQSELGNDLGNLVMRLSKLARSRIGERVPPPEAPLGDLLPDDVIRRSCEHVDRREHHRSLEALWSYIRQTNSYLNERAPWRMEDGTEVHRVLHAALDAVRVILHLVSPAMPRAAERAARHLGFEIGRLDAIVPGRQVYRIASDEPLFPRRETREDTGEKPPSPETKAPGGPKGDKGRGGGAVDPLAKLDLRVGVVEEVEPHPDAEKLWVLTVDVGGERRTICAGLREHLDADALRGLKVLVLANLKPAKLRGVESRGMVLAADRPDGKVVPVDPGAAGSGTAVTVEGVEPRPKRKLSVSDFEKAPLTVQAGRVVYSGKPLRGAGGEVTSDAEDGTTVR